ncbi:MAG: flagellar M-ring protein FliF C-terminal domain-containing protein, partial [Desulfocapsaceae bacterium]
TLTYQASVERSLERKTRELLDAMIGKDQAMIRVAAELDFARNETTSERYDPEEPVLRSEHIQQEPAGDSGTVPDTTLDSSPDAGASRYRPSVTTSSKFDYEISKTISKIIQPAGVIKQLIVTMLVADEKSIGPDGSISFQPRSEDQLDSIKSLVTSALPLKHDRGDSLHLLRIPSQVAPDDLTPKDVSLLYDMLSLFPMGNIALIIIVFLLFYFLVLNPVIGLLRREIDQLANDAESKKEETVTDSEPMVEQEDMTKVLKREIENNPVAAAHIIKRWIQET